MTPRPPKTPRTGSGAAPSASALKGMTATTADLRILIVDDHAVVRGGLEGLLAVAPGIGSVASAADGGEALRVAAAFDPHIILLDLRMPGMDGHSALQSLSQKQPQARVIILTGNDSAADVRLARQHGAAGFLSKVADPSMLLDAIAKVAAGGTHFPPAGGCAGLDSTQLSARELEVLQHLVRGITNDEIGLALGVSGQTIKGHLKHLFPKLGAATRAEAVARAYALGLV